MRHQLSSTGRSLVGPLIRHVRSMHEGLKYQCRQCDYKATQLDNLRTHEKSKHDGVRFNCKQCDQEFTLSGNLRKHLKRVHLKLNVKC